MKWGMGNNMVRSEKLQVALFINFTQRTEGKTEREDSSAPNNPLTLCLSKYMRSMGSGTSGMVILPPREM